MWGQPLGLVVAVGIVLGGGVKAGADIYLWTDERGTVHMTDHWANVPELARPRAIVRDSRPPLNDGVPSVAQPARPHESIPARQPSMEMPPEMGASSPYETAVPFSKPYSKGTFRLGPQAHSYTHHLKQGSPSFPYDIRLDPFDPNFVWLGRNRAPKDIFTYPQISLDAQAQFRNRIRALEQRRSIPPRSSREPATRP